MNIRFELLAESHFPLLLKWLQMPHVKKWWDSEVDYTLELVRGKYDSYVKGYKLIEGVSKPISPYIIIVDEQPVAYIQQYNAYDFPRAKLLKDLPQNLGALDIFIGEPTALGRNLGSKIISAFLKSKKNKYMNVFVDPDLNNRAAIKCYEQVGFKKIADHTDTNEVWMIYSLHM